MYNSEFLFIGLADKNAFEFAREILENGLKDRWGFIKTPEIKQEIVEIKEEKFVLENSKHLLPLWTKVNQI